MESITENKLQTKGIYAWMLILPVIDWMIMTVALIGTEEKWLPAVT